ncbi:hypothetical protein Tco_0094938 [Tanacetum coccineum]
MNSSFYIHASDYPKQMHVNETLIDINYTDWSQEMMNFLFDKNKVGWLITTMEKDIRTSVKYANTSSKIWADLKERLGKESALRAYELKQNLLMTQQNGVIVFVYYTKLRSLWDEIGSYYQCHDVHVVLQMWYWKKDK